MRIISGIAGGVRLSAPEGRALRPTEDRVKESVFGTLGDLRGATVLDLFAGTGALGLEALSRGAARVFFIESERKHARFIEANRELVLKAMGGAAGETRIICADAKGAPGLLPELAGGIDFVLADPPYSEPPGTYGAASLLLDNAFAEWAGPGCILALEHSSGAALPWHPRSSWEPLRQKSFGIRAVSFARTARPVFSNGQGT